MIAEFYGKKYSLQKIRELSHLTREGVSLLGVSNAAESIGMRCMGVRISYKQLEKEAILPCIVHWKHNHFIVVYNSNSKYVFIADPAFGLIKYTVKEFLDGWLHIRGEIESGGFCLLIEPTPLFFKNRIDELHSYNYKFILSYIIPYRKLLFQLILGLLLGSIIQLIFPFLTQAIVDKGINLKDISFIWIILIGQAVLLMSRTISDFIRDWILLHVSVRVNISIISDFLAKLLRLPIRFFDTKMYGDIIQRIEDHRRIEKFLTDSSLSLCFSIFNVVIFGIILAVYKSTILIIFLSGSILYIIWIYFFFKKRREIDYKRFAQLALNQNSLVQLIYGAQEIKLNNCEKQKRWDWEKIQIQLFRINIKSLSLNQIQQAGALFINEFKNIIITFIAAVSVIKGEMTLGMMLAVQYIVGQLNSPIEHLISFTQSAQDAKISAERIGEIHTLEDEENNNKELITSIPPNKSIEIKNLYFKYDDLDSAFVLENVSFLIPEGKTTAIVGNSGSGKTTLIKLLLGFYLPIKGEIKIGDFNLWEISNSLWRKHCGVVMQEGFIFSDTIANNISISEESTDDNKLYNSIRVANIMEFIETLPLRSKTVIGAEGQGLSQGQKQRLLIARAVYKNPKYVFFDEATNALDSNNEAIIMKNMNEFFKDRTVVVVAHRLSTVRNADQIIVLDKGRIIEKGKHLELLKNKGAYFNLVKNQLEL
jgi:ATP-binding cassette subfamily B protein